MFEPLLSIIIPHRDTPELLDACLCSIIANTQKNCGIVVVDDGSEEDGLPGFWPNVELVRLRPSAGFTKAVNVGLAEARGRHYVLLNSDMTVSGGWLEALLESLECNPRVGIAGAQVRDAYDRNFISCGGATAPAKHRQGWADRGDLQEPRVDEDDYLPFACVLIRGECRREVGLLDEQFRVYCSDSDYCYRAKAAGWRLCYQPKSVVYHDAGATVRQNLHDRRFLRWIADDQRRFAAKWPEAAREAACTR